MKILPKVKLNYKINKVNYCQVMTESAITGK